MKYTSKVEISIIIPAFNMEKYISRCIESVLIQNFQNIELVMINDGSTDNTLEIMKGYANKDSRILVIDKINEGVTIARKTGVEYAKGEWISFLDADDELTQNSISALFGYIRNDIDMVVGSYDYINGEVSIPKKYTYTEVRSKKYTKNIVAMKVHVGICARLIRKNMFDDFIFDIPTCITKGEDFIMNTRLGQKCKTIIIVPDIVYRYIYRIDSANNKKYDKKYSIIWNKILLESILPENKYIKATIYFYQYCRMIKRVFFQCLRNLLCKFGLLVTVRSLKTQLLKGQKNAF